MPEPVRGRRRIGEHRDMTAELLSALVLCASIVVTLVARLQQARHERRRAAALDELYATRATRDARSAPRAARAAP
jgi:hypothetical protein